MPTAAQVKGHRSDKRRAPGWVREGMGGVRTGREGERGGGGGSSGTQETAYKAAGGRDDDRGCQVRGWVRRCSASLSPPRNHSPLAGRPRKSGRSSALWGLPVIQSGVGTTPYPACEPPALTREDPTHSESETEKKGFACLSGRIW